MNLQKSFDVALAMRGMKQKDLAAEMKCDESYISRIITSGSTSVRKLQEVCNVLNFKVWEFIKLGEI